MGVPAAKTRVSYAEYLEREHVAVTKSEWFDGEIFAMSGGTPEHTRLAIAVAVALAPHLRGRPCNTYGSDLRIPETGLATYPDLAVALASIGCTLSVDEVYAQSDLVPPGATAG